MVDSPGARTPFFGGPAWNTLLANLAEAGGREEVQGLRLLLLAQMDPASKWHVVERLGERLTDLDVADIAAAHGESIAGRVGGLRQFAASPSGRAAVATLFAEGIPDVVGRDPDVVRRVLARDVARGLAGDVDVPTFEGRIALARAALGIWQRGQVTSDGETALHEALSLLRLSTSEAGMRGARAAALAAQVCVALGNVDEAVAHVAHACGTQAGEAIVAQTVWRVVHHRGLYVEVSDSLAVKAFGLRGLRSRESLAALRAVAAPGVATNLDLLREQLDSAGLLRSDPAIVSPTACGVLRVVSRLSSLVGEQRLELADAALTEALGTAGITARGQAQLRAHFAAGVAAAEAGATLRAKGIAHACLALSSFHAIESLDATERVLTYGTSKAAVRGWITGAWEDELPMLVSLAADTSDPDARHAALYRLAFLSVHGRSSEVTQRKLFDTGRAASALLELSVRPEWSDVANQLGSDPRYALLTRLEERWQDLRYVLHRVEGSQHLLVVFACVFTHARYAELGPFTDRATHNVLFVNDPSFGWYEGHPAKLAALIGHVAERLGVRRERIVMHYGSMGGYGALRLASMMGTPAIVFNPQVDLNLWATIRSSSRRYLWQSNHEASRDVTPALVPRATYYMVGSWEPDVEALRRWVWQVRTQRRGRHRVHRVNDSQHAGLMQREFGQEYVAKTCELATLLAETGSSSPTSSTFTRVGRDEEDAVFRDLLTNLRANLEFGFVDDVLVLAKS